MAHRLLAVEVVKLDHVLIILTLLVVSYMILNEVDSFAGGYTSVVVFVCIISAFMFSAAGRPREGVMIERGEAVGDEGELPSGHSRERRTSRFTQEEKEEIIQAVFDKIYVEVGRSILKKALLVILSAAFVLAVWLTKNHVDFK